MSIKHHLLLGILALQNNFINRVQLLAAFNGWLEDRAKALGTLLVEQQALAPAQLALLEALVAEHLRLHGGDADESLAALRADDSARQALAQVADADVQASLRSLAPAPLRPAPDADATLSYRPYARDERFRVLRAHAAGGLGRVSVALDEELHRGQRLLRDAAGFSAGHAGVHEPGTGGGTPRPARSRLRRLFARRHAVPPAYRGAARLRVFRGDGEARARGGAAAVAPAARAGGASRRT